MRRCLQDVHAGVAEPADIRGIVAIRIVVRAAGHLESRDIEPVVDALIRGIQRRSGDHVGPPADGVGVGRIEAIKARSEPLAGLQGDHRRQAPAAQDPFSHSRHLVQERLIPPDRERVNHIRVETMRGSVGVVTPFRARG